MKYGHLLVLSHDGRYRMCQCDCGNIKRIRIDHLKSGAIISCGCVGREHNIQAHTTHGMTNTRVYRIWCWMLGRCKNDHDAVYGQRGIVVCQQWRDSFECFYQDMGEPPTDQHSIDRKDVNGNYEPGNCRWATPVEQARNTRRNTWLTLGEHTATIAEWAEITGLKPATICARLYSLGWNVEDALSVPVRQR